MHSYEAEVSADGQVRLREPVVLRGRHRAILTVLSPLESDEIVSRTMESSPSWRCLAGVMKDSPTKRKLMPGAAFGRFRQPIRLAHAGRW